MDEGLKQDSDSPGPVQDDKKKQEPTYQLSKRQLQTFDPIKIDKKYFKDFNLKLDNIVISLINLFIDINSPKTKAALESCKINPEEVMIRHKEDFILPNDTFSKQRFRIHLYQVAQKRKFVIFERNKLKKEEQQENRKKQAPANLDQSQGSINISEYTPYRSPTELIESWIENHEKQSEKFNIKLSEIQKKKSELILQQEQQQERYNSQIQEMFAKKGKKRQQILKERQRIAHEHNSKSLEVSQKMKEQLMAELKESIKLKQESLKSNENTQGRKNLVEQLKQKQQEKLEEKQHQYEERLRRAAQKRRLKESELPLIGRLDSLNSERSKTFRKPQSQLENNSLRLPKIQSKQEAKFGRLAEEMQNNIVEVIEKLKRKEKQKMLRSVESSEKDESSSMKLQNIHQRYQESLRKIEERGKKVEGKLDKQDKYLSELTEKRRNDLAQKFERIRALRYQNEDRFGLIMKEYGEKCDRQMTKEILKFRKNMQLLQQREKAIQKLKYKQFVEKSKSAKTLSTPSLNV